VDHRDYIENLLSAHADGELRGGELREAEQHVAGCEQCRRRLEQDRELKALVHKYMAPVPAPAAVRRAILDALEHETSHGANFAARERSIDTPARRSVWLPIAVAAAVLVLASVAVRIFNPGRKQTQVAASKPGGVADFDLVIDRYESFNNHFEPNVPSDSFAGVSDAYMDAHMPGFIWNFNPAGLRLVGGRLEKLPDGRTVTYTFYKGGDSAILCTRFKVSTDNAPPGAIHEIEGHRFYSYRGYSICYSYMPGGFLCLLITRQPVKQFEQSVGFPPE